MCLGKMVVIILMFTLGILFSVSNSFGINAQSCIKYDSQVIETFKKNWVYKNFPEKIIQNYLDWLKNYKLPYNKGYASRDLIDKVLNQFVALYGQTSKSHKSSSGSSNINYKNCKNL